MNNKWVVDVKGEPNSSGFEISVIRDNNVHGKRSYGWFDADKLIISSCGGDCEDQLTQKVWDKVLRIAQETADELNNEASQPQSNYDVFGNPMPTGK